MRMLKNGPLYSFSEVEYSCPEGWELFQGKCYIVPVPASLDDVIDGHAAMYECSRQGGMLALVDTEAVQDFVQDLLKRTAPDYVDSVWISWGFYHREDRNGLCNSLEQDDDWNWNQAPCGDRKGWVCDKYAIPRECDGDYCYYILDANREGWKPEDLCDMHHWWPAEIVEGKDLNFVENFLNRIAETGHLTAKTVWLGKLIFYKHIIKWARSKGDTGYNWENEDTWGYYECAKLVWSQGWKLRDVPCNSFQSDAVLCEYTKKWGITG